VDFIPKSSIVFGVAILKNDCSIFYSSKGSFAERFDALTCKLLLFSSNNRLIRSFALLTSHNLFTLYLDLIFLAIKLSTLALK
jgi:hypothetical protein